MKKIILGLLLLGASAFAEGWNLECIMTSITQNGTYTVLKQDDYEKHPQLRNPFSLKFTGENLEHLNADGKKFEAFRSVKTVVWNDTPDAQEVILYGYHSGKNLIIGVTNAFNEGGYRKVIFQNLASHMVNGKEERYVERQMTVTCEEL